MLYWSVPPWDRLRYVNIEDLKQGRAETKGIYLQTYFGQDLMKGKAGFVLSACQPSVASRLTQSRKQDKQVVQKLRNRI